MERRLSLWGVPILALLLIVAGVWGYTEHNDKRHLEIKAENHYQHSFHDLAYQMDQIQNGLGKALVSQSRGQVGSYLSDVWRQAYVANADISNLPLGIMPFNETQHFVNEVASVSHSMNASDINTNSQISSTDRKKLRTLYEGASRLEENFRRVQGQTLQNNAKWLEAESAMLAQSGASSHEKQDNVIIDGFQQADKQVKHYSEMNWGPTQNGLSSRNEQHLSQLSGAVITMNEAAKRAQAWTGVANRQNIKIVKGGPGERFPSYYATVQAGARGTYYVDMTQKGGYIVQMNNDRIVTNDRYDLAQAEQFALRFLTDHGLKNMATILREQYDGIGIFHFATRQGNAIIYPEKVVVKVALDNGQILAFVGQDYFSHWKARSLGAPKLTEQQAAKKVSPDLTVHSTQLAVVEDPTGKEREVYEFLGTMDNNTYKVFIDANSGNEAGVEKLTDYLPGSTPTTAGM